MSELTNEQIGALIGAEDAVATTANAAESVTNEWERKYHELEKELQSNRVEQGRLKKTNEELDAAKKELAELREAKRNNELESSLSPEERAAVPDEIMVAAKKLVSSGMEQARRESEQKFEHALVESNRNMRLNDFKRQLSSRYGSFLADIGPGGDKCAYWQQYLKYNRASINAAYENGDFESFAYHVDQFYKSHLGIPVPSGEQSGSAAPDPRAIGGGSTSGGMATSGKTYTADEFMALYDAVERARDEGNYAEIARLNAEIKSAPAEGRVK